MAHRTRIRFKVENRIRQKEFLDKGIVMLPKKPIREKSRKKQLKAAMLKIRSGMNLQKTKRRKTA